MKRSSDKRGHRWHTHRYLLGKVLKTVANIEMQILCFEIGTHSLSAYLAACNGRWVLRTFKK